MPCYNPKQVPRRADGDLDWTASRHGLVSKDHWAYLACGKCLGCRTAKAREWSIRCYHEGLLHDRHWRSPDGVTTVVPNSCAVTLTYSPEFLPEDGHLNHTHFQKFIRKLRKNRGVRSVRYFMAGEYGGKTQRPHYHALLFGLDFDDRRRVVRPDGQEVQMSLELANTWARGDATVDAFDFGAAGYIAGYIAKKQGQHFDPRRWQTLTRPDGSIIYRDPAPEYRRMSRAPGLGRYWIEQNLDQVYAHDLIRIGPYTFKPPAFYDQVLKEHRPEEHALLMERRLAGESERSKEWNLERAKTAGNVFASSLSLRSDSL